MIDFDLGIQRGYEWARASANATQLEHLAREVFRPKSIFDVARFLGVKATTLLVDHLEDSLVNSSQFAEGFITGALVVLAEIYSELPILPSFHLDADLVPSMAR